MRVKMAYRYLFIVIPIGVLGAQVKKNMILDLKTLFILLENVKRESEINR